MNNYQPQQHGEGIANRVATALIIVVLTLMIIVLAWLIYTIMIVPYQNQIDPIVPTEVSEPPLKIGIAIVKADTVLNSSFSTIGKEQENGVKAAQIRYKDTLLDGHPIEFVVKDTKDISITADLMVQELIDDPTVVAIIGPSVSSLAATTHSLADQNGIVMIGPSTTAAGIPRGDDFIYRVSAGAEKMAEVSVSKALSANGVKKVVIVYAGNNTFTEYEAATFNNLVSSQLANVQGSSVISFTYNKDDPNFSEGAVQLTQSILNENPDAVLISGFAKDGGTLVQLLKAQSFAGTLIGGNGLNTPALFKYCTPNCNGLFIAQAYDWTFPDKVNEQFINDYKVAMRDTTEKDKLPGQFAAQMYTGIEVVVTALENLNKQKPLSTFPTTDPTELRKELRSEIQKLKDLPTPLGLISFTKIGDISQDRFAIAVIEGEPGQERFTITQ